MRSTERTGLGFAFAAALALVTTSAAADDGTSTAASAPGGAPVIPTNASRPADQTATEPPAEEKKEKHQLFHAGILAENHNLIRQNDLQGAAANKHVNYYSVDVGVTPTKYDSFKVAFGAYQRFLVDEGETGWRTGNLSLGYSRTIPLPGEVTVIAGARVGLPTSFNAQLESLVATPSGSLVVTRTFAKHLTVDLSGYGMGFIVRYKEAEGGAANPKWAAGTSLDASYSMPFHDPLSVGLTGSLNWTGFYNVENSQDPNAIKTGAVNDATFMTQPTQQSYGLQAYLSYTFPKVVGIGSSLTVAYAQGDSTLGSSSWMHDGVGRFYFFWRENSQVYASLSARY